MKITKQFRTETSHIVRNCTSKRCSYSIHGHSYLYEIELTSDTLDNAQMVMDFGLLKGAIKEYIDSLDHCHLICSLDNPKYIKNMKKYSDRWISLPFNPSAEMMALWILHSVNFIIESTYFNNGEDIVNLHCSSVTVHETTTGKATATIEDLDNLGHLVRFKDIDYSEGVLEDWSEDLLNLFMDPDYVVVNKKIDQQIPEISNTDPLYNPGGYSEGEDYD